MGVLTWFELAPVVNEHEDGLVVIAETADPTLLLPPVTAVGTSFWVTTPLPDRLPPPPNLTDVRFGAVLLMIR